MILSSSKDLLSSYLPFSFLNTHSALHGLQWLGRKQVKIQQKYKTKQNLKDYQKTEKTLLKAFKSSGSFKEKQKKVTVIEDFCTLLSFRSALLMNMYPSYLCGQYLISSFL
ncbi:hypothetical protein XENOCAPTIV_013421 [Xenoophorus captivus]|uniref:Uncharacterized protein n=1 Tax=Xenoophorus captivus TaxID=1517983 RepID=A0ABV0RKQ1_9TELE